LHRPPCRDQKQISHNFQENADQSLDRPLFKHLEIEIANRHLQILPVGLGNSNQHVSPS
jgi:hypothetical protein